MLEALKKTLTNKWFALTLKLGALYIVIDLILALVILVWMYYNV